MPTLQSLPTWVLSSAATRSHHLLQRRLGQAGVTGYEYRVMAALVEAPELSQSQLGVAAALDPGDVTHTVRALAERRLVKRTRDPRHGRRMLVSLTPSGADSAASLARVLAEVQEDVFGDLTVDERLHLLAMLDRVGR